MAVLVDMALFLGIAGLVSIPLIHRLETLQPASGEDLLISVLASPPLARTMTVTAVVLAVLWWLYFVVGWGVLGSTPGKRLLGLAVIDHAGRYPIGPVRAQLRLVAYAVSSLPLCAGHLLVAFRSDHRALHDILAGTRVVRRRELRAWKDDAPPDGPDRSPEQAP